MGQNHFSAEFHVNTLLLSLNYVCKHIHQPNKHIHQPNECVNEQFVNPEKAWKIAGLPPLDGVHFISLDGGKHYLLQECC